MVFFTHSFDIVFETIKKGRNSWCEMILKTMLIILMAQEFCLLFLLAQEQKKSVMKDKAQALECVNLIKMFVQLTSGMQAFHSIGNLFYSTFSCPTLLSHA